MNLLRIILELNDVISDWQNFRFRPKLVGPPGIVQTVNVYNESQVSTTGSAQPVWKLPKKPRKKRRKNVKNDQGDNPVNADEAVNLSSESVKTIEVQLDSEVEIVEQETDQSLDQEDPFKVQSSDFMNVQVCTRLARFILSFLCLSFTINNKLIYHISFECSIIDAEGYGPIISNCLEYFISFLLFNFCGFWFTKVLTNP